MHKIDATTLITGISKGSTVAWDSSWMLHNVTPVWSEPVLPEHPRAFVNLLSFSTSRGYSYITRTAVMGQISKPLSLLNEVPVTKPWETGDRYASKCLELQNPLIFFSCLIMGSALLPMASNRKEFALLGGTFLFGLGALEMVLRLGGYWVIALTESSQ